MSKAQICKCGHTKSSHLSKTKGDKHWYGKCDWFNCDCKKYVFEELKTVTTNAKDYETFIENPHYERINLEYSKPKRLLIADCNPQGFAGTNLVKCKNCKKTMTEFAFASHKGWCKQAKMVLP